MADDQRNAQVVLTADTSNYQQGMAQAEQSTTKVTASVNKLIDATNRLMVNAGKKIIGIGTVEVAGLTGATVAAAKFEAQMSQLHASAIITGRDFETFGKSVSTLRIGMGLTTSEAVALVTQLNNLGQNQQSVQALSQTFVRLGAVTGEAVGGLVDGLISLQRQMGTEGSVATEHFASSLADLSQKAGVSATSVLSFANAIAPISKVAGITQTELLGISTAFAKVGQDGYAATNTFNKFLTGVTSAIQSGSPDMAAYANLIGKTVEQFKAMGKTDIITQIFTEINREGPDAIKTLERFGLDGVKSYKAIQAVAASGGLQDSINTAMGGQKDTTKFLDASSEALNGLTVNLQKLGQTLQGVGEAFGAGLIKPASIAVGALTALLTPITNLLGAMGNIPGVAAAGMAAMTLMVGAAVRGFAMTTALAGVQNLRRNSLGAGFRAGAGSDPKFADPMYAARVAPGGSANPIMRGMYGSGQWMGERFGGVRSAYQETRDRFYTNRGEGIPNERSLRSRISGVGGGLIHGIGSFMSGGLSSLYPGAVYDPSSQSRVWGDKQHPMSPREARLRLHPEEAGSQMVAGQPDHLGLNRLGLGTPLALPAAPVAQPDGPGRLRARLQFWGTNAGASPDGEGGATGGVKESAKGFSEAVKNVGTGLSMSARQLLSHGEEVKKTTGVFKSLGSESKNLVTSLLKANTGVGMIAGGAIGKGAVKGIGSLASGAMNLAGGPAGIALMAGGALYESNKSKNDALDAIAKNTEDLSASSTYRAALGEATLGVTTFAAATKAAAAVVEQTTGKPMTMDQAIVLTPGEAKSTEGTAYTDKRIADMTPEQASSFASVAMNGASAKDARLLTLDMTKRFGADAASKIMQGAYQGTADMTGLYTNIQANGSNVPGMPFANYSGQTAAGNLASSSGKQILAQTPADQQGQAQLAITGSALSAFFTNKRDQETANGSHGHASDVTSAAMAEALANTLGATSEDDRKSLRAALEKSNEAASSPNRRKAYAQDDKGNYITAQADSESQLRPMLEDLLKNGSPAMQTAARVQLAAYDSPKSATFKPNNAALPFLGGINPDTLTRLQGSDFGAQALQRYTVTGTTVNTALQNNIDPASQMGGANAFLREAQARHPIGDAAPVWKDQSVFKQDSQATTVNHALQATVDELAKFASAAGGATTSIGQLANAAVEAAQAARTRQESFQTSGETAQSRAGEFNSAVTAVQHGDRSPEAQQRVLTAKTAVEESINAQNEKNKSIVYAYRTFSTQRDRSETQFNLQRTRSQTSFDLQSSYAQTDFDRNRKLSDDAYNLSRKNALRDYATSLKESWYQFNLQRQRSEIEFNHQVVLMAKASAKSVYDVYSRVKVEQTWSAQSLISNMADQQRRLEEQQANLGKLRKMGLSGDVIDQLGLNDPSKAQQLARMTDDIVNNPAMIKTFNDGIKNRISSATKVVTDKDSTAWQEMQRSQKLSMDNGMTDMLHGLGVQDAAFATSMEDQRKAYQLSTDLSIVSFQLNRDRQVAAFHLGMTQMATDHKTIMDQARTDFSVSYEEISGDFGAMATAALKALGGNAATQSAVVNTTLTALLQTMYDTLSSLNLTNAEKPYIPAPLTGSPNTTVPSWTQLPKHAEGGPIQGSSPHHKADNLLIRATAGEYVQPVEVVQHYGIDMMDRIRRRQIPKEELGYADGGLIWPTNTRTLSPSYPGHSGVDIAAHMGAPIYAPMAGEIFYSGWDRGYGQAIFERFASGLEAVFGHTSKVLASLGPVAAGDTIGLVGSTGHATGPHLHFEINNPGPFGNSADRSPSMTFLQGLKDGSAAMMSAGAGQSGNASSMTPEQFHDIIANLPAVKTITEALAKTAVVGNLITPDLIASRATAKYGPLLASRTTAATGAAFSGSVSAQANQLIAEGLLGNYGWNTSEMPALTQLWNNESGWNQHAKNPSSGAYGIPQSLPASKMGSIAADYLDNPETQIRWGLGYIKDRYGSPSATLSKWNTQHWYGEGGMFQDKQLIGVGEKGPEAVLPLNEKGASFLANVMGQMASAETKKAMVQAGGAVTAARNQTYYQQVDHSTTFSGAISVTSNDPNEFIRKLEDQKRMKALTGR